MENERWLSIEQIAEHLGVNKDTVRNCIKKNNMPAHKIGRLWKFLISEVNDWVKRGEAKL